MAATRGIWRWITPLWKLNKGIGVWDWTNACIFMVEAEDNVLLVPADDNVFMVPEAC